MITLVLSTVDEQRKRPAVREGPSCCARAAYTALCCVVTRTKKMCHPPITQWLSLSSPIHAVAIAVIPPIMQWLLLSSPNHAAAVVPTQQPGEFSPPHYPS